MSFNPYAFNNPYQQMYSQPMPDQLQQYRQPYQQQQFGQQQTQQQSAMVWVRNRAEADAYPVAPNTAIALWDMSGPYVHRKETDVSGRPVIKTYKLVEAVEPAQAANNPSGDFVTREEFNALATAVAALTPKKEAEVNE